jgi:hypothetical protein
MTKKNAKPDSRQLSLLDLLQCTKEVRPEAPIQGSSNIEDKLRRTLSEAIKSSPLSIHQIAGEMSHLLGETITVDMIYSWTSESKVKHQISGARLPAFCRAVGDRRPLQVLAEAADVFFLTGPEALRAEIQRYTEDERKARTERRKREFFLKSLEN